MSGRSAMRRGPNDVDIGVLKEGLAARMEELCRQLLPAGKIDGREWCVGSVQGEPGQSCRICTGGAKRGVWCDFSAGQDMRGDALDLVAQVLFHGELKSAVRWAKDWLGYTSDDQRTLARTRRAVQEAAEAPQGGADDAERRLWAKRIWMAARPSLKDTPAERYLLGRGIDLSRQLGRQPGALRYHPELWHRGSQAHWPALVAAVIDGDGAFSAVHRIWLEQRADGSVGKAPVRDPKMTLGPIDGGSIRLWRGDSKKPLKQAPAGSAVVLAEGIEDSLVLAMARPELRYLATVSLANMGNVALPETIGRVVLYLDNDGDNASADKGVERAVRLHQAAGRKVLLARPPGGVKDANALLLYDVAVAA